MLLASSRLHVFLQFTHDQNDMPMHESNAGKISKCELHHEHKQVHQEVAQHKHCLKVLYKAYILLLMDSMILWWTIQHGDAK